MRNTNVIVIDILVPRAQQQHPLWGAYGQGGGPLNFNPCEVITEEARRNLRSVTTRPYDVSEYYRRYLPL